VPGVGRHTEERFKHRKREQALLWDHFYSSPTLLNGRKLLVHTVLHCTDLLTTPSSANQRMFKMSSRLN